MPNQLSRDGGSPKLPVCGGGIDSPHTPTHIDEITLPRSTVVWERCRRGGDAWPRLKYLRVKSVASFFSARVLRDSRGCHDKVPLYRKRSTGVAACVKEQRPVVWGPWASDRDERMHEVRLHGCGWNVGLWCQWSSHRCGKLSWASQEGACGPGGRGRTRPRSAVLGPHAWFSPFFFSLFSNSYYLFPIKVLTQIQLVWNSISYLMQHNKRPSMMQLFCAYLGTY